ncbi:phage tail protein [Calothrix sp. 336/3]|uniref:phage tail protein n=1 Tax=Calothrix sp. 336/3 TaxID=1337936 RepID=UPI0004E40B01|nr:phage tail protein [Calothrix sp. 336/3]AKG20497.1 phage tail protein [Calothrix sp. 336/3]
MPELKPIPTSRFYIEFDGLTDKLVKSAAEFSFDGQTTGHEKPLASTKDGKTLWQTTSGGFKQNPNFTIEVYLSEGDMDFYNWMVATMPKSEGGKGEWAKNRKSGALVAYDSDDQETMRWKITNGWIKSYKVSEFASDSNQLAVETVEIVCEQIDRTT